MQWSIEKIRSSICQRRASPSLQVSPASSNPLSPVPRLGQVRSLLPHPSLWTTRLVVVVKFLRSSTYYSPIPSTPSLHSHTVELSSSLTVEYLDWTDSRPPPYLLACTDCTSYLHVSIAVQLSSLSQKKVRYSISRAVWCGSNAGMKSGLEAATKFGTGSPFPAKSGHEEGTMQHAAVHRHNDGI